MMGGSWRSMAKKEMGGEKLKVKNEKRKNEKKGGGSEFDFGDAGDGELMVKGNLWLRVKGYFFFPASIFSFIVLTIEDRILNIRSISFFNELN